MKRVVAYCRVSTDRDDQANSLENQKNYFERYINQNEEWELIEIYVDEGITGTSTKKRKQFNKMIADAELKLFDMIITKEISRFARNTLDSIYYTRKLKDLGIGVYFLNDNINTLEPDSELRMTIMSSIAQEESRKTSDRVTWGQKRQMEKGVVFGRNIMGYHLKNGTLTINESEAVIIRDIYDMYLNGRMGTHIIAKMLEDRGIPTKNGGKAWSNAAIYKILKNEKYCGDLIQQKTYTPSYLTHEKKYNKGEKELIIIENHHEPIIDKETWKQAQEEINRRRTFTLDKGCHSNRYVFSGKLKCACCNANFVSRSKKRKDGSVRKSWQCFNKMKYGLPSVNGQGNPVGCDARDVNDELLKEIIAQVLRDITDDKEKVLKDVQKAITKAIDDGTQNTTETEQIKSEIEQVQAKKHKLVDLYFDGTLTKEDLKSMSDKYDKQIEHLQSKISFIKKQDEILSTQQTIIDKIQNTITTIVNGDYFSEEVAKQALERVLVHDKTHFTIFLRGGFNEVFGYSYDYLTKQTEKADISNKKGADCTGQPAPATETYKAHRYILILHMLRES